MVELVKERRELSLSIYKSRFFIIISVMLAITIVGFWSYLLTIFGFASQKTPMIVHVHAAISWGWFVLLYAQAGAIYIGKTQWHKKLGIVTLIYGYFLTLAGIITAHMISDMLLGNGILSYSSATHFFASKLRDMLFFAMFLSAAVYYRATPGIHKKCILFAMTVLLSAPIARLIEPKDHYLNYLLFTGLMTSPIILSMVFDWWRDKKIDPVYFIGLAVLLAGFGGRYFAHNGPFLEISKSLFDMFLT